MMTEREVWEAARKIYDESEYQYVGLRFEDKDREIGEICGHSKHNRDREDDREFPQYGTEEYDSLYELEGTSAWDLTDEYNYRYGDSDYFESRHCYVIAGYAKSTRDEDLDDGEIVIKDAVVIAKIF